MSKDRGSFSLSALSRVFKQSSSEVRGKIIRMYVLLVGLNILAWVLAFIAFGTNPKLLLLALTAYTFGLRHAFDADHISAIDNVTRKLMQEKQQPVGVGFFFSLGHSSVVTLLTLFITATALALDKINTFKAMGELISSSVSALFLLLIAAINIVILVDIFKTFQAVRRGQHYDDHALNESLNNRGLMARIFRPVLKVTDRSWKMYPIGFLFGLGFDTATEVGLLAIAATTATQGVPIVAILIFPLLFTAGMSLLDTTDGILMLGAYGWAFVKPMRKLYYNLSITCISAIIALAIGSLEAFNVIATELNLSGPFWDQVSDLNENFNLLGILIVCLFIVSWVASTIIYKIKRYDDFVITTAPARGDSQ
ncbi:HoxN/HupN/NixA family nickel/cobalt transporter [Ktedonobacter racemifer]|uniref:Nickel/cobalt efflux system n=1 Tax=Ktedonobacter racemifer DSM 44963 TaxID=485913 RepID=D6TIN6_KTERA|nr:HoxN/HupN/NixA family nickel/cobalt transporter [Ktedonobacter racemifer]EFH89293.1 high-affinity nickel-transporter [Ktedonobacter racemifer DSM 44963]